MTPQPVEGKCGRCKQPRPLFPYKPFHDCVDNASRVDLVEAAEWIAQIEDEGDRWCEARINRQKPALLCVPCHDREVADEEDYVKEHQL